MARQSGRKTVLVGGEGESKEVSVIAGLRSVMSVFHRLRPLPQTTPAKSAFHRIRAFSMIAVNPKRIVGNLGLSYVELSLTTASNRIYHMIAKIYLALNAISIGLIGLLYLYDPNLLLARYDLETGSAGMDNMLRSTYGGVFVGASAIFLLGVLSHKRRRGALGFAVIFMAGSAIGRLASIAAVGAPPASIMPLLYYECAAAAIGLILYLRSPSVD